MKTIDIHNLVTGNKTPQIAGKKLRRWILSFKSDISNKPEIIILDFRDNAVGQRSFFDELNKLMKNNIVWNSIIFQNLSLVDRRIIIGK